MRRLCDLYLDGAANTPVDPAVLKAMRPYFSKSAVGNAHATNAHGVRNSVAIEKAREDIAACVGCKPESVLFTSGATEGNNWVIKSLSLSELHSAKRKKRLHIICGETEHDSVINACRQAAGWGMEVTFVRGTGDGGKLLAKDVKKHLRTDTLLVCAMAVNNETGVANDAEQIAMAAKRWGALTLIDCTQWMCCGGRSVNLTACFPHGDFFTFSAHKIYGPEGVGCLIALDGAKDRLQPLMSGGGQESGKRGGTSNVPGIVGMAKAVRLMVEHDYSQQFTDLMRKIVEEGERSGLYRPNVMPDSRSIISLNFAASCDSDKLAEDFGIYGVSVSAGSACDADHDETAGDFNPSHVLRSIGLPDKDIKNTIRLSLTKYTTEADIARFVRAAKKVARFYNRRKNE